MITHYDRLSASDASFLALESRTTHMHVGAVALFETGPMCDANGGIDIGRIRRHIASRLHLISRYRQRLARVPLEGHPVWVDDEDFNLEYHVRHTSLPRPGSDEQLYALAARLMSQQLDRTKPLWEFYVVEGVEEDRFGLISKIHHCMIDGIAGVDLAAVLLGLAPDSEIADPEPYQPRPAPSGAELVVRETARRAGSAAAAVRDWRRLLDDAQSLAAEGARRARAVANSLSSGWLSSAPETPINGRVTPSRRFSVLETDLSEVKEVKNALGGSVNDVLLATVAGGLRTYFTKVRGVAVASMRFRVMAPVSVRPSAKRGTMGNQVAMWLVPMPLAEPDPIARLSAITAETVNLKRTDQALGAATLVQMSAGAPATLISLASRLAAGARPFNMTVTNVPGPQFPLYLSESKLLGQYPLVPLWQSHGVGIALFSYLGTVFWGFNADYDLMPDLEAFVAAMQDSFQELLGAARSEPGGNATKTRSKQVSRAPATSRGSGAKRTVPKKRPRLGTA